MLGSREVTEFVLKYLLYLVRGSGKTVSGIMVDIYFNLNDLNYGVIERENFVATTNRVYSTKETHSSPHLLITPVQLMRPCIG